LRTGCCGEYKRDEVAGGGRKLNNQELYNLCSSPSIIRLLKLKRMRRKEHVAAMSMKRNVYRIFVGEPYGKR
jgi:hypothetical protein